MAKETSCETFLLFEWTIIPQEYFSNTLRYCQGFNEPGLDGQVCPFAQSPQPNIHFSMVRGSKTMSAILKATAWSAPSFMARSVKYFVSVCAPFFIILCIAIITQPDNANNKIIEGGLRDTERVLG